MSRRRDAGSSTPAVVALTASGVPFALHAYDHDPGRTDYGDEASEALGLGAGRLFKTLIVSLQGGRVALGCAVVPVATHLDLRALAQLAGAKKVALADPALAERATGYVVGGISPLGHRRALPTWVDSSARRWPTVFVSAGRRGLQVELGPADLVRLTSAGVGDIARD